MELGVLAAARELFDARQFPGVAAVCSEALAVEPRDVSLRLLRARALLALRRDAAAQTEVGEILRIDPACGAAYRLLGELAARRDEPQSAQAFLAEALRLAPGDDEAHVWVAIVDAMLGPAATSPLAPIAPPLAHVRLRPRLPAEPVAAPPAPAPAPAMVRAPASLAPPRPTSTIALTAAELPEATPAPVPVRPVARALPPPLPARAAAPRPAVPPPPPPGALRRAAARGTRPPPLPPRPRITRPPPRPLTPLPTEGFGAYLVDVGVLSELQLRAALAYKKSTGVRLGAAAVALGFATETRIESASLVYHGRHRRPSTIDVIATARARRHDDCFQA